MKCSLFLFSPTGGTEKDAKILCSALGNDTQIYDLSDKNFNADGFTADESGIAVIAMSSFGGRVPAIAAERLKKIKAGGMPCALLCVYGNRPYKKAGGAGLLPKANSACLNCGLCAEKCPTGAIDKNDVKKTDKAKCIYCMRCVAKCPSNGRSVNGTMVAAASLAIKKACSVRKECEIYM